MSSARTYSAQYKGAWVVVKVRPLAEVEAEAKVLRLMASDAKSHAVTVVGVMSDFDCCSDDEEQDDAGEELGALVTELVPNPVRWETEATMRRTVVDLLEV